MIYDNIVLLYSLYLMLNTNNIVTFSFSILNVWNNLPEEIVSSSSLNLFKLHLKKFDLHAK